MLRRGESDAHRGDDRGEVEARRCSDEDRDDEKRCKQHRRADQRSEEEKADAENRQGAHGSCQYSRMTLFLCLLFGAVGTVYLIVGRKEHDPMYLVVGFALIIYPYFFSNVLLVVGIGIVLSVIPYAHSRGLF